MALNLIHMFKALKDWWNAPVQLKPLGVPLCPHISIEECQELWDIYTMPTLPSDERVRIGGGWGEILTGRGNDTYLPTKAQASRYMKGYEERQKKREEMKRLAASFVLALQAQDLMEKAMERMEQ